MSNPNPHRSAIPRVFISSTADDLERFRAAAKEAVIAAGMLPVMFEYFPANANPPLKVCLDRVAETDVLIVLVAHRYGWMPRDQPKTEQPKRSITWLECEQADKDKHEVLAFFIGQDGEWPEIWKEEYRLAKAGKERKLTAELSADVQQALDGLDAFKTWLNLRKFRKAVRTPDELATQIVLALQEWREKHPEFNAPAAPPGKIISPEKYLRTLLEATSFIDIRGLMVSSGKASRFPIENLYIALKSRRGPPREPTQDKSKRLPTAEPAPHDRFANEEPEVPLQAALAEPRLVVIGDPGAGKTTFLRRVAAALCLTELGDAPQAAESRLGIRDKTFPIFLRCSMLASHIAAHLGRPAAPAEPSSPAWLAHCLATQSRENSAGLDDPAFFQRQLDAGLCSVLLDGLDEAPDEAQRLNLSQLVERSVRAFPGNRFVVTSRPPAYTSNIILPEFAHVEIAPPSDEAVDTFLQHWCRELYSNPQPGLPASPDNHAAADEHCRELLESLRARPDIRRIAHNPVMLTALAVVHWNERRLPEQRADLYESVITWLSRSRADRPGREKPERTVTLLQELALAMHNHEAGRQVQMPRRSAAEHILAKHFAPGPPTRQSIAAAESFLAAEELDSGIVVALGPDIRFWHLQFQEYLTARAIAGCPESEQRTILFTPPDKIYRPEWREVVLLLAGALHKQGAGKVDGFVEQVLDALDAILPNEQIPVAAAARCAGLLGAMFRDLRHVGYVPSAPRYDALLRRVMAIFDKERSKTVDVRIRMAAADALGQSGDPRLEPNHPQRWISIPAGKFLMGAQDTDPKMPNYDEATNDEEAPVHEVTLDAFQIARFPVAVAEYQRFVEDRGYTLAKFWTAGGFAQYVAPDEWQEQLEHPNCPVVGVSWFEAMAYCQWAGCRLPTEAEWERAARGTTARKYPWADGAPADETRLNCNGNIGAPTPVGIYPLGATPEGIADLAGNVWEWCADWYGDYPSAPHVNPPGPPTGKFRVLRGGSWGNVSWVARAAIRDDDSPGIRLNVVGFRVVVCVRTRFA